MKKLLLAPCLMLITVMAFADPPICKEFSYKNFTDTVMTDARGLKDCVVVGSCFYQENMPNRHIFPANMTGVIFRRCNLQNVFIPSGNTVDVDCSVGNVMVQNDLDDWIVGADMKPVEPVNKEYRATSGISNDVKDLPVTKQVESIYMQKMKEAQGAEIPK